MEDIEKASDLKGPIIDKEESSERQDKHQIRCIGAQDKEHSNEDMIIYQGSY